MSDNDTTGTPTMDRATMDLIAELAAQRAIEKHEERNVQRLVVFGADLKNYVEQQIDIHEAKCPVGMDFRACKAKLIGFSVGIALGSSGITVALSKLMGIL